MQAIGHCFTSLRCCRRWNALAAGLLGQGREAYTTSISEPDQREIQKGFSNSWSQVLWQVFASMSYESCARSSHKPGSRRARARNAHSHGTDGNRSQRRARLGDPHRLPGLLQLERLPDLRARQCHCGQQAQGKSCGSCYTQLAAILRAARRKFVGLMGPDKPMSFSPTVRSSRAPPLHVRCSCWRGQEGL